ncbi:uncharacterized protein RJT21DRAFT_42593 [Scheffersomyces amazonensis]|uniref:uncharacterized protein n=1 Tax=Scheffersomyces amazonensis TaxID=1078765 RepID=UPI00315D7079
MDDTEAGSPFYIHSNGSSSSNIPVHQSSGNISSQVSSVGFNNLKKLNTNTSSISTLSTSTTKNNPLTRLFTKNRSGTNLPIDLTEEFLRNNSDDDDDDDVSTLTSIELRKSGSLFKLPKNKLKFSNKTNLNKPDLTIQTAGHHGLKVSKKILSSGSFDDTNRSLRKGSVSSPVSTFQNLFHRSHTNSQGNIDGQILAISKEDSPTQSKLGSNPSRTTLALSSIRSNSYISDKTNAKMYNFTDPDFEAEYSEVNAAEHTTIQDLHKKLMVPTDQFIQNITHKHVNHELGLGIEDDTNLDNEYYKNYSLEFNKANSRFFTSLLTLTKPLFIPSQQRRMNGGAYIPNLGFTVEDVSSFIKENYQIDLKQSSSSKENTMISPKYRQKKSRESKSNSSSGLSLELDNMEAIDDFKVREVSSDLLTFFTRAMIVFSKDYNNFEISEDIIKNETLHGKASPALTFIHSWSRITKQWDYFNQKIRFYLISMFHPLQKNFHVMSKRSVGSTANIEIENSILLAFRDVIVIPFLMQRQNKYELFNQHEISPSKEFDASMEGRIILEDEVSILVNNNQILRKLQSCLGILMSSTHHEPGNVDGEQHIRNEVFFNSYLWLSNIK